MLLPAEEVMREEAVDDALERGVASE